MSMFRSLLTSLVVASSLLAPAGASSAATPDEYAGLGDSFSAGNGAFSNNLDGCFRNTYAYPYLVGTQRANTNLTFKACGGAVTSDVINNQVPELRADTDYVSITIGGNDVGFADLIINCAGYWSFNCQNAVNETKRQIVEELPAKLDATYAAIRAKAPSAHVVVLGYPRLFGKSVSCSAANGVTAQEATWANEVVDLLDSTISSRVSAQDSGFTFRSSVAAFRGHEICTSEPWVNGASWSPADAYHPSRNGYAKGYAPLVRSVIG